MERYICIHGHFYQPPRENPWLEAIELQDSAYPHHDWNERITEECYTTNAKSRILDDQGRIIQIVNNYANMSFNFGPTLLAWMEQSAPDVYEAILEADKESQKRFSDHGSALAQAYNHMILPLANRRDKLTQVQWGIQDFEHRFGRRPEGMWLPETAVDIECLDIMAEQGIRFTILAPHQARRIRPLGEKNWQDLGDGILDPTMAHVTHLPSGKDIVVFFYNGPISRAVAFEKLLASGETFAQRLMTGFSDDAGHPQLVHIATDGESYGHHHRFGDMALAYALNYIERNNLAGLTNYGEFLEKHPPTQEVEIIENTSWSCAHGVERWRSDCGCSTGGHPGWNQGWRKPLREALDRLRDKITPLYDSKAGKLLKDPWGARNAYIQVILDRTDKNVEEFFAQNATKPLSSEEKIIVLKLMELQRHAMLMFTSCGWFFDDPSGIETIQDLQYAGRVIQLAQEVFGKDLSSEFLQCLEKAKSDVTAQENGRRIYANYAERAMVDLKKACAHFAISSLFEDYPEETPICCYTSKQDNYRSDEAGSAKLVLGRTTMASEITRESAALCFGVLHLGDHNLNCGVMDDPGDEPYQALIKEVAGVFSKADVPETLRTLDKYFGSSNFSLKSLFRDERRKILSLIIEQTLEETETVYRRLYEHHAPIMQFLKDSASPTPKALYAAAELVLNMDLRKAFEESDFDKENAEALLENANRLGITLDANTLEYAYRGNLERIAEQFHSSPVEIGRLETLSSAVELVDKLPFEPNLWRTQNICWDVLEAIYPDQKSKADQGNEPAKIWLDHFVKLAERLSIRIG